MFADSECSIGLVHHGFRQSPSPKILNSRPHVFFGLRKVRRIADKDWLKRRPRPDEARSMVQAQQSPSALADTIATSHTSMNHIVTPLESIYSETGEETNMTSNVPFMAAVALLHVLAVRFRHIGLRLFATAMGLYVLLYYRASKPVGPYLDIWVFGMNVWGLIVKAINIFWFRDPAELTRSSKPNSEGSMAQTDVNVTSEIRSKGWIYDTKQLISNAKKYTSEMLEAVEMIVTLRGVGWNFQAKGLPEPPPPGYSKYRFVMDQVLGSLWRHMLLDFGRAWINSTSLGRFPLAKLPTEYPIIVRLALGGYTMLHTRWTLDIIYRLLGAVCVLIGSSEPDDWPPLMGSWTEAWTVRRFWSYTWHQMMRLHAEPPVGFVIHKVLRLPKGHYLSRWGKVFGNFAVAALLHAYGRALAYGNTRADWNMFMAHAVAVWVEDHTRPWILALGIVKEGSRISRIAGYVWTFGFTLWTWHFFMEEMVRGGGIAEPVLGMSPMDSLTGIRVTVSGNQLLA